jgi:osmotically-inducible protein OsmY
MKRSLRIAVAGALIVSTLGLSGCGALIAAGAAAGAMAVTDRRTIGAQTEDQGIEMRASTELPEALGSAGRVSVTSYNRKVLLTGQVATEQDKQKAERIVAAISNVRSVHNEVQVLGAVSLSTQAADTAITARVKTALLQAPDLPADQVKVVTEAGTVFLMGLVTRREADRAAEVTSRVSGVQRVVTVFEFIQEEQAPPVHGAAK